MGRLREMMRDYPCIGEVRGKGLMIGIELIENDAERTPARALCDRLVTRGFYNGLLLLSCGVSTVRFMPPLSVTVEEVDEAIGHAAHCPRRGPARQGSVTSTPRDALDQAAVLLEQPHEVCMRQGFRVRAAVALHVTRGDQRVDDRFFGALHGGPEQRIEMVVADRRGLRNRRPLQRSRIRGRERDEDVTGTVAGDAAHATEAERGTARDALAADAAAAARRYRSR